MQYVFNNCSDKWRNLAQHHRAFYGHNDTASFNPYMHSGQSRKPKLPRGELHDFCVATSQTISSGHSATYTITLASEDGLTGNVSLSCLGAPAHSNCSFSPSSVMLDGTAEVKVTLLASQSANHGMFTPKFTGTMGILTHVWDSINR